MISALHLIWIVPLSATVGFFWAAILAVGSLGEDYFEREEQYGTVTTERTTDIERDD
jgi:hypothetical protein